jgi:heat shock protein HslJ
VAIAAIAVALGACGSSPTGAALDLDGAWVLREGSHDGRPVPIVADARITIAIDGSEIGGTAACNLYGGTIEQDGSQITIGALTTTEMACAEPVMESEAAYLGALTGVTTATRDGDNLVLSGPGVELVFILLPPVPTAELVGTPWTLDSLISGDAVSSVAGEPALLELREDGTLSGSTGCRSFSGSYEIAGDEVRVTGLATTTQACPEELAAQDDQVLAVVGDGFTVQIDGDRLTISDGASGLGYRAAPSGG